MWERWSATTKTMFIGLHAVFVFLFVDQYFVRHFSLFVSLIVAGGVSMLGAFIWFLAEQTYQDYLRILESRADGDDE